MPSNSFITKKTLLCNSSNIDDLVLKNNRVQSQKNIVAIHYIYCNLSVLKGITVYFDFVTEFSSEI